MNSTVIVLVLLSHFAVITSGGLHQFSVGGRVFYSDFYLASGGGSFILDGRPYTVNLPVDYSKPVLKNVTLNLITLIDYLSKNDPVITQSGLNSLKNIRSLLVSMLQTGSYDVNTLSGDEAFVVGVYYKSLTKMRSDKASLLERIKTYLEELNSPGVPVRLEDSVSAVKKQLKRDYSLLLSYDYGIGYFYSQIYPNVERTLKRARFLVDYPEYYKELTAVKDVYSYLDSEGLLNEEMKRVWLDEFSPMYVKFVRGIYVEPNVTSMESALIDYLNLLKSKAVENLMKAKVKVDSYTNPPFYQKGEYVREIEELQSQLAGLKFKKFDNNTLAEVKKLVGVYKKSEELPDEVEHKYILDILGTVIVMGVFIGFMFARFV